MVIIQDLEINLLFVICYCISDGSLPVMALSHTLTGEQASPGVTFLRRRLLGSGLALVSVLQAVPAGAGGAGLS